MCAFVVEGFVEGSTLWGCCWDRDTGGIGRGVFGVGEHVREAMFQFVLDVVVQSVSYLLHGLVIRLICRVWVVVR